MRRIGLQRQVAELADHTQLWLRQCEQLLVQSPLAVRLGKAGGQRSFSVLIFGAYEGNRATGAFIRIDEDTNAAVAAGMIAFAPDRAVLQAAGFDAAP